MRMQGRDGVSRAIDVTARGRRVVVVRVFVKKTRQTPRREINLAMERAREVEGGCPNCGSQDTPMMTSTPSPTISCTDTPMIRACGVSVQEMVGEGVEVIIGVSCDPQLGPVLLFGSGGVMVEVYNDVALRRCPITRSEAQAMIAEVKGARLLQGFRGRKAADLEALADTLVRVSYLATHMEGHLAELDINPLMVLPAGQGVKAVDALVVFRGT